MEIELAPSNEAAAATGNCPFCRSPLKPSDEIIECPECGVSHHADCWHGNGDHCTVYGCQGSLREPARNRAQPVASPTRPRMDYPAITHPRRGVSDHGCAWVGGACVVIAIFLIVSVFYARRNTLAMLYPISQQDKKVYIRIDSAADQFGQYRAIHYREIERRGPRVSNHYVILSHSAPLDDSIITETHTGRPRVFWERCSPSIDYPRRHYKYTFYVPPGSVVRDISVDVGDL